MTDGADIGTTVSSRLTGAVMRKGEAMDDTISRAAVLDVTDPEPPCADSEFYSLPNVVLTPHIAGSFGNELVRMAEYMLDEYSALKNGKPNKYEVTLEMLKTMA